MPSNSVSARKSQISRFFDRIRLSEDEQARLTQERRIHSIGALVLALKMEVDLGSPTKRLLVAVRYIVAMKKLLRKPFRLAVEQCIETKWNSRLSWEMFLMQRWNDKHIPQTIAVETSTKQSEDDASHTTEGGDLLAAAPEAIPCPDQPATAEKCIPFDPDNVQVIPTDHQCKCHDEEMINFYFQELEKDFGDATWELNSKAKGVEFPHLEAKVSVPPKVFHELYPHQRSGVQWILRKYDTKVGGILADDIGMGKKRQALVAMLSLMQQGVVQRALILSPSTLVEHWHAESKKLVKSFPGLCCSLNIVKQSRSLPQKPSALLGQTYAAKQEQERPLLVISSGCTPQGSNQKGCQSIGSSSGAVLPWHWVILDTPRGSKSLSTKSMPCCQAFRLVLRSLATHDNDDKESIYSALDWATSLHATGDARIIDRKEGNKQGPTNTASRSLDVHILHRGRKDVLPNKDEFIVCVKQSESQRSHLGRVLGSKLAGDARVGAGGRLALAAMNQLRMICSSPLIDTASLEEARADEIVEESCKLRMCADLITEKFIPEGRQTLVFAEFQAHIDVLKLILDSRGVVAAQFDGRTKESERHTSIADFNKGSSRNKVMLVSLKAGGVGLTLTGADRIVLLGPSWNPATDDQAVARAHRIGQTKKVEVYRFVVAGSIEERILRRQLKREHKRVLRSPDEFDRETTCDMLSLTPAAICETRDLLPQFAQIWAGSRHRLVLDHPSLIALFHLSDVYNSPLNDNDVGMEDATVKGNQKTEVGEAKDNIKHVETVPTNWHCEGSDIESFDIDRQLNQRAKISQGESDPESSTAEIQAPVLYPCYQAGTKVLEYFHGHGWFRGEIWLVEENAVTIWYGEDEEEETLYLPGCQKELDQMIDNEKTLCYEVGATVQKHIGDNRCLTGKIASMEEDRYRIAYEDGAIEEFTFDQISLLQKIISHEKECGAENQH